MIDFLCLLQDTEAVTLASRIQKSNNFNAQDYEGRTVLMYAVYERNNTIFKLLLDHGADISLTNNSGKSIRNIVNWSASSYAELKDTFKAFIASPQAYNIPQHQLLPL